MENIFYDLLRDGATPESLADAMNAALRRHEEEEARSKRERAMREAAEYAADALNEYARMVDPKWEDLNAEDIEAIAKMSAAMRGTIEGILDVMFNVPTKAAEPKMSADDKAIADFLTVLGL